MTNGEMMTLNLRRIDVCDIRLALTGIIVDAESEMRDPATTETRREILKGTVEKWSKLKAEVVKQFKEQDLDLVDYLTSSDHTKAEKVQVLKQARDTGRITPDEAIDLACEYL